MRANMFKGHEMSFDCKLLAYCLFDGQRWKKLIRRRYDSLLYPTEVILSGSPLRNEKKGSSSLKIEDF